MKECSCIANNNFNITITHKKDYFIITDNSEWVTSDYNIPQKEFDITIINENKTRTVKGIIGGSVNINYCDLPSSSNCGNDGIYKFQVESCGELFSICEAILPKTMCAYTKLLLKFDPEEYKEKVFPIFKELEFVKTTSSICDSNEALKHYNTLVKMLEHVNCKC